MSGQANYAILQQVAKEEGFEDNFNTLYDMFQIESSGNPDAVKGDYVGGFQFGTDAGKEYGLIGEGFDHRKDLAKSARAAIKMYRKNSKDHGGSANRAIAKHNLNDDLVVYMAHQQGRLGMQDIVTGALSGDFVVDKSKLRVNILNNVGDKNKKDWQSLPLQDLANKYINFWKLKFENKKKEAKIQRNKYSGVEASLIKNWNKEDNPFDLA